MKLKYYPGDYVMVPYGYNLSGVARDWRKAEVVGVRSSPDTGNVLLRVRYLDDGDYNIVPHYAVRTAR